jgi:hypothetical protein
MKATNIFLREICASQRTQNVQQMNLFAKKKKIEIISGFAQHQWTISSRLHWTIGTGLSFQF